MQCTHVHKKNHVLSVSVCLRVRACLRACVRACGCLTLRYFLYCSIVFVYYDPRTNTSAFTARFDMLRSESGTLTITPPNATGSWTIPAQTVGGSVSSEVMTVFMFRGKYFADYRSHLTTHCIPSSGFGRFVSKCFLNCMKTYLTMPLLPLITPMAFDSSECQK